MNIRKHSFFLPVVLVLLLCSHLKAWAQNVVFTTQVSAPRMGLQDQIQVSYTIEGADRLTSLAPAASKDFRFLDGPYTSHNNRLEIINGQTRHSVQVVYSYIAQPLRKGRLIVPGAVARDASGHTYQSNAVPVEVLNGSLAAQQAYDPWGNDPFFQDPFAAQQQPRQPSRRQQQQAAPEQVNLNDINRDLFIRVNVDKTKVHVGEQVTASYKLYARLPMNVGISKLPSLNGFWTQDFEIPRNPKPVEETVNGKRYQVFLLKKSALFPQQSGSLELDPVEAEGIARIARQVRQRNPFAEMFENDPFFQQAFGGSFSMNDPFFDDGFFSQVAYQDVPVHLKSAPVSITVTPLPDEGRPSSYTGAVGRFSIAAQTDKTQINTEEVLNLRLTITGSGNLKLIEAPALPLPSGLSAYDPQVRDTITGRSTAITGSKIINYTIAPSVPGDYTIPPITFSYFDPQTSRYHTLSTQAFRLAVVPGPGYKPGDRNKNATALTDIHDIRTMAIATTRPQRPLPYKAVYWAAYALPLLAFLGLAGWRKREEELSRDTVKLKGRKANKIALRRLSTARRLLKENQQQAYFEEVSKAIWLYLSDKFNIPLARLSKDAALEALSAKNIPPSLLGRLQQVTDACELALYAPAGSQQMQDVYQEALTVISELEEKL